jgi:hypothetical protein
MMQLTDEQRKAIEWAIGMAAQHNIHKSPLRALLSASKPAAPRSDALREVIEALKTERESVVGSMDAYNSTEYNARLDAKSDAIDDCIAHVEHLLAASPAAPAQSAEPFPYQKTFNAIAAATKAPHAGCVEISVIKFREAFGAAPSLPARAGEPCTECGGSASIKCESKHCPQSTAAVAQDERAAIAQNLRNDAAALRANEGRHTLADNMERAAELLEARAAAPRSPNGDDRSAQKPIRKTYSAIMAEELGYIPDTRAASPQAKEPS